MRLTARPGTGWIPRIIGGVVAHRTSLEWANGHTGILRQHQTQLDVPQGRAHAVVGR